MAAFRLDTVLRIRETERDVCRLALAEAQRSEAELLASHQRTSSERTEALDELRTMHEGEAWSADRVASRQQYAERLAAKLKGIECEMAVIGELLTHRRNALLEADTAVKALEKLAGRHVAEEQRAEQASEERERDDQRRAA
jgi:flagellar FliJ protein